MGLENKLNKCMTKVEVEKSRSYRMLSNNVPITELDKYIFYNPKNALKTAICLDLCNGYDASCPGFQKQPTEEQLKEWRRE